MIPAVWPITGRKSAPALKIGARPALEIKAERVDLSSKSVVVCDRGLFLHIARRLGRDFGKVYYYLDQQMPGPLCPHAEIGKGMPEIEVVDSLWKVLDKTDMVVFADVYNGGTGGLPEWLVEQGYNVFGSLGSEVLETDRVKLKEALKRVGLPTAPDVVVKGFDEAQKYLKDKKDKYIKTSYFRGTMETYHYENAFLADSWFDKMRHENGLAADKIELLIEDPVEAACEAGFESPMLDGELPENLMVGYEKKGKGYAGAIIEELPDILAGVHEKLAPEFKKLGYQGWYSNEIRIDKKAQPYYLDCTSRFGSPPSEVYCEIYENFSEAVWNLAHGELPELRPRADYGVQINLCSPILNKHWLPVQFPSSIDEYVKLKNCRKDEKGYLCIPNSQADYVGSVIAIGDDLDEIKEECIDRARQIAGEDLDFDETVFEAIDESIEAGEKYGIMF